MGELQRMVEQRRGAVRMEGVEIHVSMRKMGSTGFKSCSLLNVTHGGVGLLTDNVNFRILKPVELQMEIKDQQFMLRGLVAYRQLRMEGMQYGVIFTHVPFELEQLLLEFKYVSSDLLHMIAAQNQN